MKTRITINKKTLVPYFCLFIISLIEVYVFGLIKFSPELEWVLYSNREKWGAILAIVLFVVYYKSINNRYLNKLSYSIIISIIIMYLFAIIKYPKQGLITTYGRGAWFLLIILCVPIYYIIKTENSINGIMKFANFFTIFSLSINNLVGYIYMKMGKLYFLSLSENVLIRNGKLYLQGGAFLGLITIYNLFVLMFGRKNDNNKKYAIVQIILYIINLFFVAQSRAYFISVLLSVLVYLFCTDMSKIKKILLAVVIILTAIILNYFGVIDSFINTFKITGEDAGSTLARTWGYRYYLKKILANPIFGIGFAGENEYFNLVHGTGEILLRGKIVQYRYSDVGIVGLIAQTGIFSLILYILPVMRFFIIIKKVKKICKKEEYAFLVSVFSFVIITSATLIITASERVIVYAIIIAVYEFFYMKYCRSKEGY